MGVADEERDWIQRSREGDAQAYRHLVERYQTRIYRLVSGLLGYEHGNIDDVVQEVFVKAYFSLKRFREKATFATWIYRIAVNRARDEAKRASRHVSLDTSLAGETVHALQGLWNQAGNEEDDDPVASESLQRFVSQAVTALPDKLRTVVTLKDLEGLSYQEVGQILKCSVGTVKSRHSRAREKLRTLLGPHLPDLQARGSES
ncbi:MAG: sigma-70 family RNA polymerase sigma factor [Candidatus Tectomicrobia bacterium]|nr:sigma-70 family RNA polymerase sigma factor [Candidatus Tectomicrobia bacterium]